MKKHTKKIALLGIAGLLMSGGFFMIPDLAEEVQAEEDDVFQVLFPANTDHVFDFIMDPQGLINMTDAAAYGGLTFEEGATLFFRRYDGRVEEDYSSASDALVITNMGTADVDIVLSASISSDSMEKITMTDDSAFTDDTEASFYLALTDGECTVPVTSESDAVIRTTLSGSREAGGAHEEYRFWLVGAANSGGDWSEITDEAPKVTVTWSAGTVPGNQEDAGQSEAGKNPDDSEIPETVENPDDTETSEIMDPRDDAGTSGTVENPEDSETSESLENPDDSETRETVENPDGSETLETAENPDDTEAPETVENSDDSKTPETMEAPDDTEISETDEPEFDEHGESAGSDGSGNVKPLEENEGQGENETSGGTE